MTPLCFPKYLPWLETSALLRTVEEHFVPITVRRDGANAAVPHRAPVIALPDVAAGLGAVGAGLCPSRSGVVRGVGVHTSMGVRDNGVASRRASPSL